MYQFLRNVLQIMKPPELLLGRWSKVNETHMYKRVDYANTDHCGTCYLKPEKIKIESYKDNHTKNTKC